MAKPKVRDAVAELAKQYEALTQQRDAHRAQHAAAFAADGALSTKIEKIGESLKPLIRPRYDGAESGMHAAYVGPVTTIQAIVRYGSNVDAMALYDADPGAIKRIVEVNPELARRAMEAAFMVLVKENAIDLKLVKAHTTEKQLTTAIRFDRTSDDSTDATDDRPLATIHKIR